jgi:hypothetical protein
VLRKNYKNIVYLHLRLRGAIHKKVLGILVQKRCSYALEHKAVYTGAFCKLGHIWNVITPADRVIETFVAYAQTNPGTSRFRCVVYRHTSVKRLKHGELEFGRNSSRCLPLPSSTLLLYGQALPEVSG